MDPHQKFSAIQLGSVDVAHYQEDAAQRRLAFVKSIADPDKEEQRLCRASSILDFQRIAVAEALSATPEARKALQKKYFEDLPKELQKQVEGYECRLKARDEILDPTTEQLVRLTKDNRTQYLATFQAEYYAKEVPSYPQVILDSSTADLLELKERLDILATEWRRSVEKLIDKKTERTMQFDDREKFLSHMLAANRPAGALEIPEEPQWVRHIQLGRLSGLRQALEAKAAEENVGHWLTSREAELTLIINRPLLGGWTLLHHACFYGSVEITRYLLQHGANPASQTDENPERGYLPAHVACILENLMTSAILDLLERFWVPTSHGGRLANCRGPYDRTPLHTAALYGNREAVDWLLKHQADPNVQEDQKRGDGQTPLHNAALRNHPQIIDLLLAGGARWTLRNRGKETPLLTALSYNSPRGDCRAAVLAFIQQGILLSQAEIQAVQSLRVQVRQAIEVRYVQILIEGHLGDMFQRAIEPNRWRAFVAEATSLAKEGSAEHLPVPASTPLSTNPSALWNASCSAAPSSSAPAAPATTPPKPLPASSAVVTSSKHPITAVSKIVLPKPPQLPPEEPAVPPKPTGEPPVPPK